LIVLFLGITSTALVLENNLTTEGAKKSSVAVQALAYIGCKGNSACMAKTLKTAKCASLAAFNLGAVHTVIKSYHAALKKKNVKAMKSANASFKKAMKPMVSCNITPKNLKAAFARGLKIAGSKKVAKKLAKKAKTAVKKVKGAKKAKKAGKKAKKSAKKAKKSAKKAKKSAKKSGKKSKKAAKKSAKKAKKSVKKNVKKAKKAAKKAVKKAKKGKKGAKKALKKAGKKIKKAAKGAKKAGKKAGKALKKGAKKVKKAAKVVAYVALAKSILALAKLC
jgi:hypothetical protein